MLKQITGQAHTSWQEGIKQWQTYERERIQKQHEAELNLKRQQHQAALEREKIIADQHELTLKKQIEQQIKISEMVKNIQESSNTLDAIVNTAIKEKEMKVEAKQAAILELERKVTEKLMEVESRK